MKTLYYVRQGQMLAGAFGSRLSADEWAMDNLRGGYKILVTGGRRRKAKRRRGGSALGR